MRPVLALAALVTLAACDAPPIAPGEYPLTDHFDGQHFFNPDGHQGTGGQQRQTPWQMVEQALTGRRAGQGSWPKHVPVTPTAPPRGSKARACG